MTHQTGGGGWWPVSVWEFTEVKRKLREIAVLPHGQRGRARQAMAADYGVSERTLLRWAAYDVEAVRCAGYEALFVVGRNRPSQVTPWEQVA